MNPDLDHPNPDLDHPDPNLDPEIIISDQNFKECFVHHPHCFLMTAQLCCSLHLSILVLTTNLSCPFYTLFMYFHRYPYFGVQAENEPAVEVLKYRAVYQKILYSRIRPPVFEEQYLGPKKMDFKTVNFFEILGSIKFILRLRDLLVQWLFHVEKCV